MSAIELLIGTLTRFARSIAVQHPSGGPCLPKGPDTTIFRARTESHRQGLRTLGARLLVAGHGLQILDDPLDVFLRQRIEVGHLGSGWRPGFELSGSGPPKASDEESNSIATRYVYRDGEV